MPPDVDDLDELEPTARRGAHRARRDAVAVLVPVLLVVAAVLGVTLGALTLLGGEDDARTAAADPAATAAPAPGATDGAAPGATDPAATGSATPTGTATPTDSGTGEATEAPGDVDREVAVRVLNGTRTSGLAAGAAQRLEDRGWASLETGNFREEELLTTVFYGDDDLLPAAEALAADLGGADVVEDPVRAGEGITAVLGQDYEDLTGEDADDEDDA